MLAEKQLSTHSPLGPKMQSTIMRPTSRPKRPFAITLTLVAILYLSYSLFNFKWSSPALDNPTTSTEAVPPKEQGVEKPVIAAPPAKVPLEAHIMSKCPDARDCLRDMVVPAMQKVWDKVDFSLSYIGTPTANDGVQCMHGAEECMGNILELCAAEIYPSPINYLGFTMCLSENYRDIPQRYLVEGCALEHGLDFDALNKCASDDDGAHAVGMLRRSVERSSAARITMSCTVRLNEEIYCIRDGGEWKDCPHGSEVNDLVLAVEKLYRSN